ERFPLYRDEHPAERSYPAVELRRLGLLKISEEPLHPRCEMLLEQRPRRAFPRRETGARKRRHDLTKNRGVILGLSLPSRTLEAEWRQALAQRAQRPLMQKAGKIVRAIGQKLATTEPDEEIEVFAFGTLGARFPCRLRQPDMRKPKRARITGQTSNTIEQGLIRRSCKEGGQQGIFASACRIDLVDLGLLAKKIRPQDRAADASDRFHREHPFSGHARPVRD